MSASDLLREYHERRDFDRTPEPKGSQATEPASRRFVVQKHDASTLHYDFRLEIGGVLKSWSVPKGPPLHSGERRLAVPTEDHPLEYATFEGVIPEGAYGGGVVMVWDRGAYRNLRAQKEADGASMLDALDQGKIEIELEGEKLRGAYVMVRTAQGQEDERWLLMRMKGGEEVEPSVPLEQSALTGRTLEEIGGPRQKAAPKRAVRRKTTSRREAEPPEEAKGSASKTIEINGHTVELTHLDRVLFPDVGLTKGDLVEYYQQMAPWMLPYMRERPLTMHRFPNGIAEEGFYQRLVPDYFPDWITRVEVEDPQGKLREPYAVCNNAETLVYLANLACITPHIWLSRTGQLHHPDRMIFDLDPPSEDFEIVAFAAHQLHELLQELGLVSFAMTTGSRGLHVVVPIAAEKDFTAVRAFAEGVAQLLAQREPKRLTTEMQLQDRRGRLFLDYLRNAYSASGVAPYAVRAKPGAPVATPLSWEQVQDPDLRSDRYTMRTIQEQLDKKHDPWKGMFQIQQSLDQAWSKLKTVQAHQEEEKA